MGCYDIVTSSQGKNLEELSWSVRVAALKKATEEEKKAGGKDQVSEAIKEGAVFDDVKILCGRLFKQLGRFADRQIAKLNENNEIDDNDQYRHQKTGDRMLRTAAKIAQKAEDDPSQPQPLRGHVWGLSMKPLRVSLSLAGARLP